MKLIEGNFGSLKFSYKTKSYVPLLMTDLFTMTVRNIATFSYIGKKDSPYIGKEDSPNLGKKVSPYIGRKDSPYIGRKDSPYIEKIDSPYIEKKDSPFIERKAYFIYIGKKVIHAFYLEARVRFAKFIAIT